METAESASGSVGPHYAPEDPTLAKPWKGLIDGSTGLQYYWNPETNVTQYERPAAAPLPLPSCPPTSATTPKMAPLPVGQTRQSNGTMPYPDQQQQTGQPLQNMGKQFPLQQHSWSSPYQQSSQQVTSQHLPNQLMGHQLPNQQPTGQLPYQQPGQQLIQQQQQQPPGQQLGYPQQGQLLPQQHWGQQMQHHQPRKYSNDHMQQVSYQPTPCTLPQQMSYSHPPGQQVVHQKGPNVGFQRPDEAGFQHGNQPGSNPSWSSSTPQTKTPPVGVDPLQSQKHIGAPTAMYMQQSGSSLLHPQQSTNLPGSMSPNRTGKGMVHNLKSTEPSTGLNKEYEADMCQRTANAENSKGMPMLSPQQPKLGAYHMAQNPQEMRMNAYAPVYSSGNMAPGHTIPNMHNSSAACQTSTIVSPTIPSPAMLRSNFSNISSADVYMRQHEVTAMGENVPAPFMSFEMTGFPPEILKEMHLAGFSSPTPIQAQTWPIALQGRDIVAVAKTGSGKTLGYLIPAFIHLRQCRNDPRSGPTVLVLSPTRELATQIQDEAIKFGRSSRISCTCLYGGAPKGPQLKAIEQGPDIIVATPGRLNDILEMNKINFHQVSFLVLDEADRMLDMGFEPQIRRIVNEIPRSRQTLMYTATWPKEVTKIAGDLLLNPVQVNIGRIDELAANKAITQYVEIVMPMDRQRRLEQILRAQEQGSRIIIFCSTKRLCDQLARGICRNFGAAAIHGDKSQSERDWALNQFRSGKSPVLVATDVAARGLDVKDIRVVINYDFPTGIEDYVHRIGRTGRAGATGVAYTFFSDQDWKHAADLIKVLEGANQQVPLEVREVAARGGPAFSKSRGGVSRWEAGGGRMESGGGRGMRDGVSNFAGRGRNDFFGARGGRGRGFGGPGGRGFNGRGLREQCRNMDGRGGQYDNRRYMGERMRDRSYSRSPERIRNRGYSRSRSRSRSQSRSRSRSWTRSRSYSPSRSRSYSRSPSRSRRWSHSQDRLDREQFPISNRPPRVSGFDAPLMPSTGPPLSGGMPPMSPGPANTGSLTKTEQPENPIGPDVAISSFAPAQPIQNQDIDSNPSGN